MLFWVVSTACKAIQIKVVRIWRAQEALYMETSFTNILLNNVIVHYWIVIVSATIQWIALVCIWFLFLSETNAELKEVLTSLISAKELNQSLDRNIDAQLQLCGSLAEMVWNLTKDYKVVWLKAYSFFSYLRIFGIFQEKF